MNNVLPFNNRPKFTPVTITPDHGPMPERVASFLSESFIGLYKGLGGWLALDRAGIVHIVTVEESAPNDYDVTYYPAENATDQPLGTA